MTERSRLLRDAEWQAASGPLGPPGPAPDDPRVRFRRLLLERVTVVSETAWYFEQVGPRFSEDPEARLVVEELLDHIARLMLFEARHDEEAGVSVWASPMGAQLVVSAIDAGDAIARISRLSRGCDDLCAGGRLRSRDPTTMLGVICGEARSRLLQHAIELRRLPGSLRLVSLDSLLTLARAMESGHLTHAIAAAVLQPARPLADPLISALASLTSR